MSYRLLALIYYIALIAIPICAIWPGDPADEGFALLLFKSSGLSGVLVTLNFLLGVAALLGCARACSPGRLRDGALLREADSLLRAGRAERALALAEEKGGYAGRMLAAGLSASGNAEARRHSATATAAIESARVNGLLMRLSLIGNVGPMIGLLGAVAGLNSCFRILETLRAPTPGDMDPGYFGAAASIGLGTFSALVFLTAFFLLKTRAAEMMAQTDRDVLSVLQFAPSAEIPNSQ